jgi:hypothetical protein
MISETLLALQPAAMNTLAAVSRHSCSVVGVSPPSSHAASARSRIVVGVKRPARRGAEHEVVIAAASAQLRVKTMSAASKTNAYAETRARLYDGSLLVRADERELLAELRRLRTRRSAGSASVISPRSGGSHGDRASALSLAVLEQALRGGGTDGHARTGGGSLMGDLLGYGAAQRGAPGGDRPEPDSGVLAL